MLHLALCVLDLADGYHSIAHICFSNKNKKYQGREKLLPSPPRQSRPGDRQKQRLPGAVLGSSLRRAGLLGFPGLGLRGPRRG